MHEVPPTMTWMMRRSAEPRLMREGRTMVRWGMATANCPVNRMTSKGSARIDMDGSAMMRSGTHGIGARTYAVMPPIAAGALDLPVSTVRFELGDIGTPQTPASGGPTTIASVSPGKGDSKVGGHRRRRRSVGECGLSCNGEAHPQPADYLGQTRVSCF
jgi:xanthine dehydrogenase YagR molybdenum-binding subunit